MKKVNKINRKIVEVCLVSTVGRKLKFILERLACKIFMMVQGIESEIYICFCIIGIAVKENIRIVVQLYFWTLTYLAGTFITRTSHERVFGISCYVVAGRARYNKQIFNFLWKRTVYPSFLYCDNLPININMRM